MCNGSMRQFTAYYCKTTAVHAIAICQAYLRSIAVAIRMIVLTINA